MEVNITEVAELVIHKDVFAGLGYIMYTSLQLIMAFLSIKNG